MGCVKSKPENVRDHGFTNVEPERRPTMAGASLTSAGEAVKSNGAPDPPTGVDRATAYNGKKSWEESLSQDSATGVAKAHSSDFFAESVSVPASSSRRASGQSDTKSVDAATKPQPQPSLEHRPRRTSRLSTESHGALEEVPTAEVDDSGIDRPLPEAVFGNLKGDADNVWKDTKKRMSMHVARKDEDDEGSAPSKAAEAFHNARRSIEMRRASVGQTRAPILLSTLEPDESANAPTKASPAISMASESERNSIASLGGEGGGRRRRSLAARNEGTDSVSLSSQPALQEPARKLSDRGVAAPTNPASGLTDTPPSEPSTAPSPARPSRRNSLMKPSAEEHTESDGEAMAVAPKKGRASLAIEGSGSNAMKNVKKRRNSLQSINVEDALPEEGQTMAAREFHKARNSLEFKRPEGVKAPVIGFADWQQPSPEEVAEAHGVEQQQQQQQQQSEEEWSAVPNSIREAIRRSRLEVDKRLSEKALKLNTVPSELCKPLLLLSVLPLDTPAPIAMLQSLWAEHVSPEDIPDMVERLEEEGYIVSAQPTEDSLWLLVDGSVQDSLQLAVGDLLPELHSFLLQSYVPVGTRLADVPDDGYFMHNVTYHLSEAGQLSELKQLLCDPFWLEEKLHSYGVASSVVDFRRYLMNQSDPEVRLLLQAFQMSVGSCLKHIDACILPSQMASRLLTAKDYHPGIANLVADIMDAYTRGKSGGRRSSGHFGQRSRKTRLLRKKGGEEVFPAPQNRKSAGDTVRRLSNVSVKSNRDSTCSRHSSGYTPIRCMVPATSTLEQAGQGSRMTLRGHSAAITCMELSPDAMDLVTSSADGSTCVWDTEIGDCVLLLEGDAYVTCIGLALNAGMVLTGTKLGTIQVWDLEGGVCRKTLRPHKAAVNCLKVAPNGSLVVSGSANGSVGVWALASDCIMHHMAGHTAEILTMDAVFNVPWTPDNCQTLTGSSDFTARLWDLRSGKSRALFEGHTGWVISCCLTIDGELAVTGSNDHTCRVWDCTNGECLFTLKGHIGPINAVAVSNEKLATASDDHSLRLWDVDTGEALHTLSGHNGWLTTTAIADDVCIAAGSDCNLSVWDAETGTLKAILEGHSEEVVMCQLSSNAKVSVTISADNSARVWDLESAGSEHKDSAVPPRHSGRTSQLVACQGGIVMSAGEDGRAYVWNSADGTVRAVLDEHTAAIKWLISAANGRHVISVSGDRMICTWDLADLSKPVQTLPIERGSRVKSFATSADGKVGAIVLFDSSLSVLNLETREVISTLQRRGDRDKEFVHSGGINGVVMSEDGQMAVTYSKDMTARVWDVTAGCCKVVLEGHTEDVLCATLSADKSVVVTASYDGTARVWDASTGHCRALLPGHGRDVHSVVLSPDGSMVVTLSGQVTKVWETETGSLLYSLSHGLDEDLDVLPMAVFNDIGTHMLTAIEDRANIWALKSGHLEAVFVVDCTITSAVFSGPPGNNHSSIVVGDVNGNVHFASMPETCQKRTSVDKFWEMNAMAL